MASDLSRGLHELLEAQPDYEKAGAYYDGDPEEFFSSVRLRRLLKEAGERFKINMAKTAVDVVADRLRLGAVTVPDNDVASQVIEEISDANDLQLHGPNFARRAVEFGDCYAIVWPFDDGTTEADDDDQGADPSDLQLDQEQVASQVEITYVSPLHGRMIYDSEHPNRKAFFILRWAEGDRYRTNLYYADRIERYITREGMKGRTDQEWQGYEGGEVDNPYGEIPVFHFRTDAPYGEPEHKHAYGPQDAINKLFVTQMSTTDSHGFPQRIGLVDPAAVLDEQADDPDWDDDADAPVATGQATQRSGLRSGPGTLQLLTGLKSVQEFGAADPMVFIKPFELYVRAMAQTTTTPLHYFDPTGDAPSGESRRAADLPLDRKVDTRKTWLGATWAELWMFALKIRGIAVDQVDVRWEPNQVMGDADAWTVIEAKQRNGVPQRQTLLEAGYTADQVDEWLGQQAEEMDLIRRVEVLDKIGEAVQKLGSGIGFGILTAESAAAVIERILGQAAPVPEIEETP